jgi:actin-like protein 6B
MNSENFAPVLRCLFLIACLIRVAYQRPPRQYEFPTGFNAYYGIERFTVGEQLFHHTPALLVSHSHPPQCIRVNQKIARLFQASNPNLPKTIPQLITESLRSCDPELRQVLMGNIVLTGGGTLLAGFGERLASEMSRNFTHVRISTSFLSRLSRNIFWCFLQVKIHAPGNTIERKYGGWLGGSILASLGTFHQLWISKEEWQVRRLVLYSVPPVNLMHLSRAGAREGDCWTKV